MVARRARVSSSHPPGTRVLRLYALVAAGTALGGVLRALVSMITDAAGASTFPWATLIVNVVGSFLIGFYATLTAPDGRLFISPLQRQFMMVGVFGGFTTFSVFSLETFGYAAAGAYGMAALNVTVSVAAWLFAVWGGHALAMRLNRLGGT